MAPAPAAAHHAGGGMARPRTRCERLAWIQQQIGGDTSRPFEVEAAE